MIEPAIDSVWKKVASCQTLPTLVFKDHCVSEETFIWSNTNLPQKIERESPVSQHATRYGPFINESLQISGPFSIISCATDITLLPHRQLVGFL